ncbi:MAG: hypothetical protein JXR86_06985 [Spirochaetales bacterium]|nr:hypothetical protein [Spirochaetales bacterium]
MKKIFLVIAISSFLFGLTAQSRPFEDSKNSYDPFIAQKGGFESLFVNPAAMAGETDVFTWDLEGGTQGKKSTYESIRFMMENSSALTGGDTSTLESADVEQVLDLLGSAVSQEDLDTLTLGTAISGKTAEQIQIWFAEGNTLTQTDIDLIADSVSANQDTIIANALGNLQVTLEFTTKMGTLINGFGLGVYGNAYSVLDAGEMGFDSLIAETGIKTGYGFKIGNLGLGLSGDFAMIGDFTYDGGISMMEIAEIMNQTMYYGYAWGIDAGVTLDILPSLTIGAVMTDLIGTYNYAGHTTLENMLSGTTAIPLTYTYQFDLDLDLGITWAPKLGEGKILNASFSADYYNIVSLFRPETRPLTAQDALKNMRLGAQIQLLSFINARAQYYQEYFTLGAGVDLLFIEVFGEFQFKQTFDDIGAAALVKLHF